MVFIASGEGPDGHVHKVGFVTIDKALRWTRPEIERTSFTCSLPWMRPGFTGAFGVAELMKSRATKAALPRGATGVCLSTSCEVRAIVKNRCGADPLRTTSVRCVPCKMRGNALLCFIKGDVEFDLGGYNFIFRLPGHAKPGIRQVVSSKVGAVKFGITFIVGRVS